MKLISSPKAVDIINSHPKAVFLYIHANMHTLDIGSFLH